MSRLAFGLRFTLSGGIWVVGSGSCGLGLHCVNYWKNGNKINSEVKDLDLGRKFIFVFLQSLLKLLISPSTLALKSHSGSI